MASALADSHVDHSGALSWELQTAEWGGPGDRPWPDDAGSELQKALELPGGVPPGMGREISPVGEQPTATKIKDEIKHSENKVLEDAIDHGPKVYSAYKDRLTRLHAQGKVLSGGYPVGGRPVIVLLVDANTETELYEILEGLPLWEEVEVEAKRMWALDELDEVELEEDEPQ